MGPELLRVKDLARRSNDYDESDYKDALKVLERMYERRDHGIIFFRGGANNEVVPSSIRNGMDISAALSKGSKMGSNDNGSFTEMNELREKSLYRVRDEIADVDIRPVILKIDARFRLIIYADASFAIGDTKQSVSGYVIFLNGTPLL
jgi:hypothetical protein